MPEMTTMPLFQPAPSANSAAQNVPIAPANVPNGSASATVSSVEAKGANGAGGAPDSFADVLRRQLAQADPGDGAVADIPPAFDPTLALQLAAGEVALQSSASVSIEALPPDLPNSSDLPDPLSLSQSGGPAVVVDSGPVTAAKTSDALLNILPDAPKPGLAPQPAGPAKEDDAVPGMPPDGVAALAPFIQSIQPTEVVRPSTGLPADEKKPVAGSSGRLLATAAARTPVLAQPNLGKQAGSATPAEFRLETADKSAEFAAAKTALAGSATPHASHGPSSDPETSFETLLNAAQAVSQHRNSGVQAAAPLTVQTPVGTPGWDGEIGDKLTWMVGRQQQRAELVLNPPQMGRIEVSISMSDGQTSALFVSPNPEVREALEAALPRLRELLADAGINLGQAQVGADTGNNAGDSSTNNAENRDNPGRGLSKDELSPGSEILRQLDAPQWLKRGNGLVDTFA